MYRHTGCKKFFRSNQGFTLAEVLVTLAIIGVVAALTIPTLLNNIQENEFKSAWKKNYSVISQALINYKNDHGHQMVSHPDYITNDIKPYLSIAKTCNYAAGCWHLNNNWYDFSGNPMNQTATVGVILTDGTFLNFTMNNANCTDNSYGLPRGKGTCGLGWVDVNGFKKPNTIGRDIFGFWVQDDGISPMGTPNDLYSGGTSCQVPNSGRGCSAMVLLNQDY